MLLTQVIFGVICRYNVLGGAGMNLYKDLYFKLFAVMADAVEALEKGELEYARKILIAAEQEAEEIVISAEEE